MPCCERRGCAVRFAHLDLAHVLAVIARHGTCAGCEKDITDHPRFAQSDIGLVPYCPACYEERWPTGAPGPFEAGKDQVYP